jgi:hypothetical protein
MKHLYRYMFYIELHYCGLVSPSQLLKAVPEPFSLELEVIDPFAK